MTIKETVLQQQRRSLYICLSMDQQELIPHLFRTEFRKITAVLCKLFGIEHIEIAEDIAGETFLSALEIWPYKGIPPTPRHGFIPLPRTKRKINFTVISYLPKKLSRR